MSRGRFAVGVALVGWTVMAPAQETAGRARCRDAHPLPACGSYFLFELNAGGNVAGTTTMRGFRAGPALPSWFGWDVGWMWNPTYASSLGGAIEIGGNEDGTRIAVKVKHRRWLERRFVFDAGAGPLMAQHQTGDGVLPTYGVTADLGLGRARIAVATVGVDVARQQGRSAFGAHLGGRLESAGVGVASAIAAIGGLVALAALRDGIL